MDPSSAVISELELKLIRNIADEGFLIPYPIELNGSNALIYSYGDLVSLTEVTDKINMNEWRRIILKFFDCVETVMKNGFLNVCNLCLDPDHVMLDQEFNIRAVYIPVEGAYFYEDEKEFVNALRLFVRTTGENTGFLDSDFRAVLADAGSTMDRIKTAVEKFVPMQNAGNDREQEKRSLFAGLFAKKAEAKKQSSKGERAVIHVQGGATEILEEGPVGITLVYTGDIKPLRFDIKDPGLVIGKQEGSVDLVIPFSKAVSRIHCKVGFEDGAGYIEDLGSSNGTFVNGNRYGKGERTKLEPGDKVKIANVEFEVEAIMA